MRILRNYILREFITPVLYCFLAFASLYVTIELFGQFDKIISAKPPASLILRYMGGFLAKDFQWLITPSLLLGGLYTMWQLARHSEITAMRANGISFITITSPMLFASLFFAALIALNSELYAPKATRDASQIKAAEFCENEEDEIEDVHYNNSKFHREWQIGGFQPLKKRLRHIKITWTDTDGNPVKIFSARRGFYSEGAWWFTDGEFSNPDEYKKSSTSKKTDELHIMPELLEKPEDFLLEISQGKIIEDPENLSVKDMMRYIDSRPNLAKQAKTSWKYDIANRFAAPFACIVITLFAIPAGVATGRQSVFIGVVSAILMFLVFYVLTISCGVMAKKGVIPIPAGILIPNVIFLSAGLYLFWRQR